ncbi:sulfur carrier protein ThiS [Achromobacter sp. GG226]|uniref:sulfur carrier protein ThiS n=1 Tax=Verticiella alkaliphila TaxID=2779529 RepID=UPI001C0DC8CC|nr:sulfur carrier protein ThiS [Verticiella sp. GG226]MBU4612537.1 sulfur carrier protein ThiS [Verticiella sp. GG226]
MEIQINGAARTVPDNCTVAQLIDTLGYAGKRVAIERNGDIVPRSAHAETVLTAADQIEIVVAVGGG